MIRYILLILLMKDLMYVSSPSSNLYKIVYIQVAKQIDGLIAKINFANTVGFLNLQFTQQLIRVFTSLVAFLATLYEFSMYCVTPRFSQMIV